MNDIPEWDFHQFDDDEGKNGRGTYLTINETKPKHCMSREVIFISMPKLSAKY